MTKTFYCDMETYKLIEEARKLNPEFNLSLFIKNSLKNVSQEEKKQDISYIKKMLGQIDNEIENLEMDLSYWKGQEIKYYEEQQEQTKKEKEQVDNKNSYDKIANFIANINEYQEKEYREGLLANKWRSYWEYAKTKIDL